VVAIPEQNLLRDKIELQQIPIEHRPYLGYSELGDVCRRKLWYRFRFMFKETITPRVHRLFSRGHREEPIVVADLRAAGVECKNVLDEQVEVIGPWGHVKGHPDGDVLGVPDAPKTWHNLEIKTANEKRFTEFQRFGVKRSNPKYWVQANQYMGHKKQTRTLFVVVNKNTDERHYERVEFDKAAFEMWEGVAEEIITATEPLDKIAHAPEWFECKYCPAHGICWQNEPIAVSCRSCAAVHMMPDGEWHCGDWPNKGAIPLHVQRTGCNGYRPRT